MESTNSKYTIGGVIGVFLTSIVGLALTPSITTIVNSTTANMTAGAAKELLLLFPLFWVILLIAVPVVSIAFFVVQGKRSGNIQIWDLLWTFLLSIIGLSLTPTIVSSTTTALVNLTGAASTLLTLFPLFWVIYLIGIPVVAIAIYFVAD